MTASHPDEGRSRQKRRNWAVFLILTVFVLLTYAVTIVKMHQGAAG